MTPATLAMVLVLLFAPASYVRREWRPAGVLACVVDGSRDRTLHGKARRRARKGTR